MSGLYMDHPDWTPEQRVAVAAVAILRLRRGIPEPLSPATAGPSRDAAGDFHPLDRAVAGDPLTAGLPA